ncbi:Protein involved in mRNA turnover and stability protein [Dioscorea alata]|uniref:Protein involved in mRNA turnover and stability protein n=1 Tax=Dioscorea alata TaxID=55571 RepID=A0ACB7WC22_DIOAL|nr:Protein involved in mRNA turnover and stability protein [Dioscorea alata]
MVKEAHMEVDSGRCSSGDLKSSEKDDLDGSCGSDVDSDKEGGISFCRVCHCAESDSRGDAALGFLDILPPLRDAVEKNGDSDLNNKVSPRFIEKDVIHTKSSAREPKFIEFVSPEGEVFVCSNDLESGSFHQQDMLVSLGCSCKNELALAHYACALKWFISHGSTVCEICGNVASNVRSADFKKVMASLKDYESLRERTATGEVTHTDVETNSSVDPDALAAIRRQRLSEISLWFNPHNNTATVSHENFDQLFSAPTEQISSVESSATRWTLEGTGILVATGLLTLVLAWLVAPHVGKKIAISGLYILLGCVCALTTVVSLRFISSRFTYGPTRYWTISFVFGFLIFGIWAERTRHIRSS